jgi:hypothetical protein
MGPSSEITAEHTTALEKIRQLAPDVGSDAAEVLADLYSSKRIVGTESDEPVSFDAIGIDIGKGAARELVGIEGVQITGDWLRQRSFNNMDTGRASVTSIHITRD